jgi:hypothetical protein
LNQSEKIMTFLRTIGLAVCLIMLAPAALQAQVFLVGACYYSSTSDGAAASSTYLYSTNSSVSSIRLMLDLNGNVQNNAISYLLAEGDNVFNYSGAQSFDPGPFGGIEVFFSSTAASYNPGGAAGVAGDLVAATPTDGSGVFFHPAAGTLVRSYDNINSGNNPGLAPYSGATSFTVGDRVVTITAFDSNTFPNGTFTLNVTAAAVPEPGHWILIGSAGAMVVMVRQFWRRPRARRA